MAGEKCSYPSLTWRRDGQMQYLEMAGEPIVELDRDRWYRFLSRDRDMRWIGADFDRIDAGWGFYDGYLDGYVPDSTTLEDRPEEGRFILTLNGHKEQFPCENRVVLEGTWRPETGDFRYTLRMSLKCALEDLYRHSLFSQRAWQKDPSARPTIRIFDFYTAYACQQNFNRTIEDCDAPRPLYPWVVMRAGDGEWVKEPRSHVAEVRGGIKTPAETFENDENSLSYVPIQYSEPGSLMGVADKEFGGWLLEIEKTPGPVQYSFCWYAYDVHVDGLRAVPPRGSCQDVDMEFACRFTPISPKEAEDIVDSAREYRWRDQKRYDIPLLTAENHFDRSMIDLPGEEIYLRDFWQASDDNCFLDKTAGFDTPGSACIERTGENPMPSAWYAMNWGRPHNDIPIIGRRFRLSAMVKCENVTGRARVGMASTNGIGGELFYGFRTHYADGAPRAQGASVGGTDEARGLKDMRWMYSDSVTGTSDWTEISVEFDVYGVTTTLFLEMSGTGKCWFDNVRIEDVGPMRWTDVQLSELDFTKGVDRYWERHRRKMGK